MSMTDPIADFLARIRNAILARKAEVLAPRFEAEGAASPSVLQDEGFIAGYDVRDDDGMHADRRHASAGPTRAPTRSPACAGVSRPGQRVYVRHGHDPEGAFAAWASRSCRRRRA